MEPVLRDGKAVWEGTGRCRSGEGLKRRSGSVRNVSLETKTQRGWRWGENLLQPTATPGQGQDQPEAGQEVAAGAGSAIFREPCFLIHCPPSPHPDSLCLIKGWYGDLHTPPEVLPSLCYKEFDSAKEAERQKRVRHGSG